jgi:hypothetical protein
VSSIPPGTFCYFLVTKSKGGKIERCIISGDHINKDNLQSSQLFCYNDDIYNLKNMLELLPKILGACGLLFITWGIFIKDEIKQDWIFVTGGLLLLVYSISLRDPIFIPLQIIFTLASFYEIVMIKQKKKA